MAWAAVPESMVENIGPNFIASIDFFFSFNSFFFGCSFLMFDFSYVDVLLLKSSPALGNKQHNVIPGPYPSKEQSTVDTLAPTLRNNKAVDTLVRNLRS